MMNLISLEDYEKAVSDHFRKECDAYSPEEVEKYLDKQENEIENCYRAEVLYS